MRLVILSGLMGLLSVSCSEFRKIQKSNDWEVKYKAAFDYYEKGDYYKAAILFEEVLPLIRGGEKAELAQYYYAYSYYHQKQYVLSGHYFRTFFEIYSRSEYAEEAMFMYAYSLSLESPAYSLDQTSTQEAIQAMQSFFNRYPNSEYKEKAMETLTRLRALLEKKAFENAKLYHKLRRYKAAVVAFENFQDDFPDAGFNEEIGYLLTEAEFELAKQSISSKQKERFQQTITYYEIFVDNYPDSKYLKSAQNIYENCLSRIQKLMEESNKP